MKLQYRYINAKDLNPGCFRNRSANFQSCAAAMLPPRRIDSLAIATFREDVGNVWLAEISIAMQRASEGPQLSIHHRIPRC